MSTQLRSNVRRFPKFPLEAIKGLAKEFVDLYSPVRESCQQALFCSFATIFGLVISPYCSLNVEDSEPRLFCNIVGASAWTRKSTSNNTATEFFEEVLKEIPRDARPKFIEGFATPEGLLKKIKSDEKNPTLQRVMVVIDEINTLARTTGKHSGTGTAALHKLFSGHKYEHPLVRDDGYTIANTYLAILSASTPEDFTSCWDESHITQGFLNRWFLVGAESASEPIAFPKQPDQDEFRALVEKVRLAIAELSSRRRILTLSEDAQKIWADYYADCLCGYDSDSGETCRLDNYGFRWMTLLSAVAGKTKVDAETVKDVIQLLDYQIAMRRSVRPIVAMNQHAELEELVRERFRQSPGPLTKREVWMVSSVRRFGKPLFDSVWNGLTKEDGELEKVPTPSSRTERFRLVDEVVSGGVSELLKSRDDESISESIVYGEGSRSVSENETLVKQFKEQELIT